MEPEVVYYDPTNPASFGGVAALARQTRSSNVGKWLSTQDAYTLHKPVRRIFPRRKTFAKGIDDLFQADLADIINYYYFGASGWNVRLIE